MGLAQQLLQSYENALAIKFGPIVLAMPNKKRVAESRKKHSSGFEYETISEVLGELDKAFGSLENKNLDRETERLIKSFGLFMFAGSDDSHLVNTSEAEISAYGLPAVMPIIFSSMDSVGKYLGTTIVVFKKMKEHHRLEPASKDSAIYEVCYFFSSKEDSKKSINKKTSQTNFFCEISKYGQVRQLKHLEFTSVSFKSKRGVTTIPKNSWAYQPTWNNSGGRWIADQESGKREASAFFNVAMGREMNANVIVENSRGYKVVFLVPMHRWKYFFKDRIDVMVGGRKTKIFHYVAGHERKRNDKIIYVKPHTRGSRDFQWGDYNVRIVLPGKHGAALSSFNLAPDHFDNDEIPSGYLDESEVYCAVSRAMACQP
jgi:hypothetical protein